MQPSQQPKPDQFSRYYLHRDPLTVIDMLSLEYYQNHTEGLGEGGGVIVRKDKVERDGLLDVAGLVSLVLGFGLERGVTEQDLYKVPYLELMKYQDLIAEHGIGAQEAINFRISRANDAAFMACADAADFVRREYLKRKARA